MENAAMNPNNPEATSLFEQYESQRSHFLNRRINEIKETYGLTADEEAVLLGFFNTNERETKNNSDSPLVFNLLSIFKHHKDEEELAGDGPGYIASLGWLRIYWSSAWRRFAIYNQYLLSARFAVNQHRNENIKERYEAVAIDDVVNDLKEILPSAERALGLPIDNDYFVKPILDGKGTLSLDAKKLKWLKQYNIGKHTKKYIEEFEELINNDNYDVNRRLDVWNNPLYFSRNLAVLRWKDRISKFVQRKQDNSPALTYQFFNQVNGLLKRDNLLNESKSEILSKEGKVVSIINKTPGTTISTIEQITKSNIPVLASITSHYLWRWFVENAHKQHLLDQEQPYKFEFIGGYPRLGELSGAGTSANVKGKIKTIIALSSGCGYLCNGKTGTFQGNLLSYEYFEAYGQKSSKLTINLARPLCPGFVEELPEGNSKYNHQRILIPWVRMPLLIGNNAAHHAPQSSFQLDMNTQMRLRASEIYERGGILLSDEDILELAKNAGLSPELVYKVIDAWIQEGYLEKVDDCVYMLGKRYPDARESLFVAGEISVKSAERGRVRKKAKSAKLRGQRSKDKNLTK